MFQSFFHPLPEPGFLSDSGVQAYSTASESQKQEKQKELRNSVGLKKSIQGLKNELTKEKEVKQSLAIEKENLHSENIELKRTIREREHEIMCIKAENSELKEKLHIEKTKVVVAKVPERKPFADKTNDTSVSNFLNLFKKSNNEGEVQKLITENTYLKKQLQNLVNQETRFEEDMENVKAEWKSKVEALERKLRTAEDEIENRVLDYQGLLKEKEKIRLEYVGVISERDKIQEEARKMRREQDSFRDEIDKYELTNSIKSKQVCDLVTRNKELEQELAEINDRFKKFKDELYNFELNLKFWEVKRIGRIADTRALVLFRKNVFGDLLVEIEHPDNNVMISPNHIESFGNVEGKPDQFFIHYKLKHNLVEKETFETPDARKILKCLKYMMKEAAEKVQLERKPELKKGFFSQVASLFI